jgi:DNA polymerase
MSREAWLAALAWQVELGADEAIGDAPVDRFAVAPAPENRPENRPAARAPSAPSPVAAPASDAVSRAEAAARACATLPELAAALAAFDGCALKQGARSCVFADGNPRARVMVIGEAPGRDEDLAGLPFVGRSGRLLDRMLAAIGLDRRAEDPARAVYITNVLPWRPVDNRDPATDEVAMMVAFLRRHVELADPEALLLMGKTSAQALLGTAEGITRLRGRWAEALGRPALPTLHPAYLLRNPPTKRLAWRDLLSLRAALDGEGLVTPPPR